jgi:hypothetical protein
MLKQAPASYPAAPKVSRRATITSARVDPRRPPAIFRPLRRTGPLRPATEGPCGGTGRRARLKIEFRKECWFDSGQGHQAENTNNNNYLRCWFASIFSVEFSRGVENTRKNPLQPFVLLAFLLVSEEQTFSVNFHYCERKN